MAEHTHSFGPKGMRRCTCGIIPGHTRTENLEAVLHDAMVSLETAAHMASRKELDVEWLRNRAQCARDGYEALRQASKETPDGK